ncbi:MAG: hypothetical protein H7A25_18365 [Leptospiraceae bacterium]|nr:hypothetical protein [Leptospiraceae bacterium]
MQRVFIFSAFLCLVMSLSADRLSDSKKILDSHYKNLNSVQQLFTDSEVSQKYKSFEDAYKSADSAFRGTNRDKTLKAVNAARIELKETEKAYTAYLSKLSSQIIDHFSSAYVSDLHSDTAKEGDKKDKLQKTYKANRYLNLARSRHVNAEKFERERNYYYSLHLFQGAIRYTVLACKTMEVEVPQEFKTAESKWFGEEENTAKTENKLETDTKPEEKKP